MKPNSQSKTLSTNCSDSSTSLCAEDHLNKALIERWQHVCEELNRACLAAKQQSGIDAKTDAETGDLLRTASPFQPDEVILLAVSKTKPAAMIETLAVAGQRHFGENYLQEAIDKMDRLKSSALAEPIIWHYIGHIQRNKTRDIAEHFDWVQTVEREIIARRLNDQRPPRMPPLNVLIQVNIDLEDTKSGCSPEQLPGLIDAIKPFDRLKLRGLMIIPARDDNDAFTRTKALFDKIAQEHPDLANWDTLSMGMSGDMTQAIAAGSTMVRVGTAIFGARD